MKSSIKTSTQREALGKYGSKRGKSVENIGKREQKEDARDGERSLKKMRLIEGQSAYEGRFGSISSIGFGFEKGLREGPALEGEGNKMSGTESSCGRSFQTREHSGILDRYQGGNCGLIRIRNLEAETEGFQRVPELIVEFAEIGMDNEKNNDLGCVSGELGGFLEMNAISSDCSPLERATCPKIRYKKSHSGSENGKVHFLETPLSPESGKIQNFFSQNSSSSEFVFETPERRKCGDKTEIRALKRPTQKHCLKNFEMLDWAMSQNEIRSQIEDSDYSYSNRDPAFSLENLTDFSRN